MEPTKKFDDNVFRLKFEFETGAKVKFNISSWLSTKDPGVQTF
jgi:hypothetical protein